MYTYPNSTPDFEALAEWGMVKDKGPWGGHQKLGQVIPQSVVQPFPH